MFTNENYENDKYNEYHKQAYLQVYGINTHRPTYSTII